MEFAKIEDIIMKPKLLRLQLSDCGIFNPDNQEIMAIVFKLKAPFDIFVSPFYSTIDTFGANYKKVYFEFICELLTHNKENLLHMGALDTCSKHKALFVRKNKGTKPSKK